jgi:hypothetical protein
MLVLLKKLTKFSEMEGWVSDESTTTISVGKSDHSAIPWSRELKPSVGLWHGIIKEIGRFIELLFPINFFYSTLS